MFTSKIRRIASKIVMATMLFSVLSPLTTGPAIAAETTGNLQVAFDNADGGFTVTDFEGATVGQGSSSNCPLQTAGTYAGYFLCQFSLKIGTYKVTFDEITTGGTWQTPPPKGFLLNESGYVVIGDYIETTVQNKGVLGIDVNNADGGYTIKDFAGVPMYHRNVTDCGTANQNGYTHCTESLNYGTYTVVFDELVGFNPPADEGVTLSDINKTYDFQADYTPKGPETGTLTVGIDNPDGGFIVKNFEGDEVANINGTSCGAQQPNGYYMCLVPTTLIYGTYSVEFKEISGFKPIPNAGAVINSNTPNVTIFGNYVSNTPTLAHLTVGVNLAEGGFDIRDFGGNLVETIDPVSTCGPAVNGFFLCSRTLAPGTYTLDFTDVVPYKPVANIGVTLQPGSDEDVWAYYSLNPTGVIEVRVVDENDQPITNLPANEWQMKRCSNSSPATCADILASGGSGDVYSGLSFATYRIVFPSPIVPAGYVGRTVSPLAYQELDAQHTSRLFIIKYTKQPVNNGDAYVNVRTTPVQANVKMVVQNPAQPDQQAVTSDPVNGVPTYDLSNANRFTLPTLQTGFTASTQYYVECPPAPGGYHAPANPFIQVDNTGNEYAAGSETLAGTCTYTNVNPNEKVTITVDTINVDDAAIFVDGVQQRPNGTTGEVSVIITTTETHVISFEQNPANNSNITGYTPPDAITIPANVLDYTMTGTDLVDYLGYYVPNGNLAVAEVNIENATVNPDFASVYITIGNDATKWNVGVADTTATPLYVQFDRTINHEFHFQDRNTDYYLRAVPVTDPTTPGFTVSQDIQMAPGTMNVTYFQERYTYAGPQTLTNNVQLVGDYIADGDASFFRARTTNADPVYGEIYLDINGEAPETLIPGAQTWTRVFISDVNNDNDTTTFENNITVAGVPYTAVPLDYDLNDGSFPPVAANTVYDLESTYIPGGSTDLTVQLIPAGTGSVGLTVTLDAISQTTIDNAGTFQTTFVGVDPNTGHTVDCPNIPGYVTSDLTLPTGVLTAGIENFAYCIYVPSATAAEILIETEAWDNVNFEAPITLRINGTDYPQGTTLNDADPTTPARRSIIVDSAASNTVIFGDMPGYDTPAPQVINVTAGSSWQDPNPANVFNGLYTDPNGTGATLNFHLRELDPNDGPVPNTDVILNATTQQSDVNGDTTFTGVDVSQLININFGNHPLGPGAYVTPLLITFDPGQLVSGQTYDFTVYYVPVAFAVVLDIETLDEATQLINVNGAIYLIVNNSAPSLFGFGTASVVVSNAAQYSYAVDWGPALVPGYIEPAVDPLAVDVSGLAAGAHEDVTGLYRNCVSGNCEIVTITAWDETGLAILNSATITVNGNDVGNGQHIGTYDVGAVLNIAFEDVPTHAIPEIEVNGVSVGNTHNTIYAVLDNPSPNTIDAYYDLDGSSVGFNVGTRDNQNNPLTEDITHGITGTETTEATPAFFAVTQTDLANYVINFADRTGYITPGSVTVVNQAIASVPANVLITNNGTPYVPGSTLVLGDTYDIVGTYVPYFTIEKNIVTQTTIANNNKRVDYQIVVTRDASSPAGNMTISLHDTISDNGRTLTGTNGGTMSVVSQNGSYSTCSNGCGDITLGTVNVPIDNPGNSVTITYQTVSNNSAIPVNLSSDFVNTLTGTFTYNAQQVQLTDTATVNVLAATAGPGPTPPGGGGGGGGGGGVIMIKGDMILEVTKLVSLNNKDFVDASDPDSPLAISERVDSTLFTKVKVKNLGQVTATNIKYSEGFDEGDSKITSDEIQNVKGEAGFSYNDTTGVMTIDKLIVGGEINFSYEQIVHENGSKGELAEEYLVLEGFSTKLTQNQDGLTKHGIGDHFPSWLVAGDDTVVTSTGNLLELSIKTDKAAARVGEEVTYKITAKNNADFDFTGVIITWDYDENALEIINPFGGRNNGTEIHWDRGILRPGQTVEYQVRTRVSDTAPVGGNVRTLARGLVNELENPAAVDHYLTIIAGISPGPVKLAQTGMPTFALIFASLIAYLMYTQTGRRRYLALKKAALRPL